MKKASLTKHNNQKDKDHNHNTFQNMINMISKSSYQACYISEHDQQELTIYLSSTLHFRIWSTGINLLMKHIIRLVNGQDVKCRHSFNRRILIILKQKKSM